MNGLKKTLSVFAAGLLAVALLPMFGGAEAAAWQEPGNTDLNILNGGVMLTDGEDFYFNHGGVFLQRGEEVLALSPDDGVNLNLSGNHLFYTVGSQVYRMPASGGSVELVHTASGQIKQLYVIGESLSYITGGRAYQAEIGGGEEPISGLSDIMGLIPTQYGNLFLTGEVLDYTLWAGDTAILENVQSCYTDSGYLSIQIDNENYMARLSGLFDGFSQNELEPFNIHGGASLMSILDPDDENTISEYNENNDLVLDFNQLLIDAGFNPKAHLMTTDGGETTIPEVSQGQKNIVKRARQLHEIEWTPLENRSQWGNRGTFYAETTYKGLPYGQPVNTNGYVGYGVSLETYAASVLDNTSRFYTEYSNYNKIAPTYSTDCSGYVSYAWGLTGRKTTYSIPNVAEKVGDQSVYSLQIGDCLDKIISHVVLISDLTYDSQGNIIGVEVMEQTPVITKLTRYGSGESRSLASFQSYYLNGGYVIYRNPNRDSVTYTPSPVVPLDGESVTGQKDKAPKTKTTSFLGGKTVELYADDPSAVIYYTTDGTTPTISSTRYSGPLSFRDTTKLKAIAVTGQYSGSTVLNYTVKVPQIEAPAFAVSSGLGSGQYVSSGSKISISSVSGAKIYYTTDGSEPTASSSVYSSPITVNGPMTIKAMAQANGYKQSLAASASYVIGSVYTINASAGANGSISPSGSSNVIQTGSKTFTIIPASGFKVEDVLVDGSSVGAVTSYTFSNVTGNHTISASFKSSFTMPFTDVSSSDWFYDAVSFVYANSLFNGVSNTQFAPDDIMTRGMFVTVVGRFAGVSSSLTGSTVGVVTGEGVNIRSGPSTDTSVAGFVTNRYTTLAVTGQSGDWYQVKYGATTGYIRNDLIKVYGGAFSDLNKDIYYSPYVQWASIMGLTEGVASGVFGGEAEISRQDMCRILYNYTVKYGKTLTQNTAKVTFTDDSQISSAAKTAVYALQQAGVINGMGDGSFAPQSSAARSHVAQIFRKFASAVK